MSALTAALKRIGEGLNRQDWPAALPLLERGGALSFEPRLAVRMSPLRFCLQTESGAQVVVRLPGPSFHSGINSLPLLVKFPVGHLAKGPCKELPTGPGPVSWVPRVLASPLP